MSEHEGKDVKKVSEGQWTTSLYDCFSEDIPTCCFTWFCPCVAFGRIAEILDKGETGQGLAGVMVVAMSHIGCGWYYASTYRAKLRRQYSLPEEPCSDGAIHFFCCSCALSQEHRELKYRGLDPSLDAAFKNTGLERANNLGRDLEWFKEQGYDIPEPMAHCKTYSRYFKDIAENDPLAFICHFCNIYLHIAPVAERLGQ